MKLKRTLVQLVEYAMSDPEFVAELDKHDVEQRAIAQQLFPDGVAECRTCPVNCQTFWSPDEDGGDCGYWGIPLKRGPFMTKTTSDRPSTLGGEG